MGRATTVGAAHASRPAAGDAERAHERPCAWWLAGLGLVLLALAAYAPAFRAGWVWDDIDVFVTNNPFVKSWDGIRDIWFGFYRAPDKGGALVVKTYQYYPLVFSSFWLDHKLWGLEPAGYHALNVVLHLVNAALVFVLARRLAIPGAAFVAGLFALHPTMVESVAWVSERKNVLSGFFYLSAFLAYLRFDDDGRWRWLGVSLVLFLGALLSKTVTATLPAALLLALVWRHGTIRRRDLASLVPYVLLGVGLGWFSVHLERYAVGASGAEFSQTVFERVALIVPRAFVFYALKAVWPHPVTFIYPRFDPHAGDPLAYAWLVACVAAGAVLVLVRPRLGVGPLLLVLFSAATLAPALGFVPVYPHRYSWVADHFAYLGNLGFFALIASAAVTAARHGIPDHARRVVLVGTGTLILVACAVLSNRAARTYHDEETLWADTLAESPDAWIAMINLGINKMLQPPKTDERQAAALELFQRAERYQLGRLQALTNQGIWYRRQRRYDEAAKAFRGALALQPGREKTRQYLADLRVEQSRALLAAGRSDEARQRCLDAVAELGSHPRLTPWCAQFVTSGR